MSRLKKLAHGSLQPDADALVDIATLTPADFEASTSEEKENFIQTSKSISYWQDAWRRFKKNTVSMIALGVVILLALFAFVGPYFVDYSYEQQVRGSSNLAPFEYSEKEQERIDAGEKVFPHVFGTDNHGRDIMVRVMVGTRVSMLVGVLAALLVLVIGAIYGSISGYFGGIVDAIMMRLVEIIYTVPDVLVVLLLSVTLKPALETFIANNPENPLSKLMFVMGSSLISIFITFGLLYWVTMARIIRGQVMQLKQQEYITAARALGASGGKIIRTHLLPNSMGSMIAATSLQIPSAIFLESFLSFLGFGVSAPLTSLGSMCSDGLGGMYTYPHRLFIPAILLSVMILSFNLVADGLRDALDPRLKK